MTTFEAGRVTRIRTPTRKRARVIARSPQSVLRCLQNEILGGLSLEGRVLDVGGGKKAKYYGLIESAEPIVTLNINPRQEPTYLVGPDDPFPLDDGFFDVVLCIDTLEHIYDRDRVMSEMMRVLKAGGMLFILVPFFFPVHGSPYDFHRQTAGCWLNDLDRHGANAVEVEPLAFGPFSSTVCHLERFRLFRRLRGLALRADLWLSRNEHEERVSPELDDVISPFALAYAIRGRKGSAASG